MKKRITALLVLVALTALVGCSPLLERSYTTVEKHYEQYVELDDSSAVEVSDARSLESAITYFVREGMEVGTVRARDYDGSITDDLTEICLDVQSDALGAYAVQYISHEKISMVTYSEINIYFTYRRTAEQMTKLHDVSYYNLESELTNDFAAQTDYAAYNIQYTTMSDEEMLALVEKAANFAGICDTVGYTAELYPESGLHRILEVSVNYGLSGGEVKARCTELNSAVKEWKETVDASNEKEIIKSASDFVSGVCAYSADGGSCAYDAIVVGEADSLGMARAVLYLCNAAGISCDLEKSDKTGVNGEEIYTVTAAVSDGIVEVCPLPEFALAPTVPVDSEQN